VQVAFEEGIPAPVISAALYARFGSRQEHGFGAKLLSAMRRQFGGHAEAAAPGGASR
jgi:6-phosphogluconate dehydrogenase